MKFIINPFTKIAGLPALSFGTLFIIIGSLLAGFFKARFDGALDLHFGEFDSMIYPLIDQIIVWLVLIAVFYLIAILLGSKPRLLDIAGTFALARIPYTLAPLVNAGGIFTRLNQSLEKIGANQTQWPFTGFELLYFIFLTLGTIILVVWLVTLYYNAYKSCTNLKGNRLVISFIVGLILAEFLSVYLIRVVIGNGLY